MPLRRPEGTRFDPPGHPFSPASPPDIDRYLQTRIMVLEDAILDRDRAIAALAKIKASRAWKLAEKSSATVHRLAPPGSLRRKVLKTGFHAVRKVSRARHASARQAAFQRIAQGGRRAILSSPAGPTLRKLKQWCCEAWSCARGWANPPQLPGFDAPPRVSIVIPVYNHCHETIACLESIAEHTKAIPHEVIVVDDCSRFLTSSTLNRARGLKLLRNTKNLGFILSCNRGAEESRGEYVLFLNNDTTVTPGWLEALLETFASIPDAGYVGAKLIYPDGRLQQAGGVIWRDASGWNYGKTGDPRHPRYNFRRETDYCSGACIMLPRALFLSLGGFDERYRPAYYEDTDLAFKVREAGLKVIYEPAAEVIHHEGLTWGTDTSKGIKSHQVVNQVAFRERWRERLERHPRTSSELVHIVADNGREGSPPAQILMIDHKILTPDRDSGSLRMMEILKGIRSRGAHVTYIPHDLKVESPYDQQMRALGIELFYSPFCRSIEEYLAENGRDFSLVVLSRADVAWAHLDAVRRYCPRAKVVFDTVDLYFVREGRAAEVTGNPHLKLAAERRRLQELSLVDRADATLVVSPIEQRLLERECPGADIRLLPNIIAAPKGDLPGFTSRSNCIFIGNFEHFPNVDAVMYFVETIMPLIIERLPDLVLEIVGSNPTDQVLGLACENVRVLGYVADLAPIIESARVAVAPLRFGAGVKGKVNLAMAHGTPNVVSGIAAEGMHLVHGESAMIADDPADFATALTALYTDERLWAEVSRLGRENVRDHFSVEAVGRLIDNLLAFAEEPPRHRDSIASFEVA
jgi:GT2 family glycosyltransferase/glycosyltransferase involved in cell wall biosynthesis